MAKLYVIVRDGVEVGHVFVSDDDDGPLQMQDPTRTLTDVSPPHIKTPKKDPRNAPTTSPEGDPHGVV